jgi:2-polyprenyl-6-hydroxyphenyl methylase/3-demethylubiquinone-9 3-methyltransferase
VPNPAATIDQTEIDRFAALADQWWDGSGKFAPLHRLNPTRLRFIRDRLARDRGSDIDGPAPLAGMRVLDVGCGGGLVAEPLARMGAMVTGIDPAVENIRAAQLHAEEDGLDIAYEAAAAEELIARGETFDAVLALEVVEHVPDAPAFVAMCGRLVRPGGVIVLSTLNRTLRAFALAIVGAEFVLRWLPVGTHRWDRFVTPDELAAALTAAGFSPEAPSGMIYDPLADSWRLGDDVSVNYIAAAVKRQAP